MYMRIYNDQLIKVYTVEDLKNSEVISELKGRKVAGFTTRDKENNITFYDIDKISAKELQLMIRNLNSTTIAITLDETEIIDYFYLIARVQMIEHNREKCTEQELYEWMNSNIDSGIINSCVWDKARPKIVEKLKEEGFFVSEDNR